MLAFQAEGIQEVPRQEETCPVCWRNNEEVGVAGTDK